MVFEIVLQMGYKRKSRTYPEIMVKHLVPWNRPALEVCKKIT